MIRLSKKDTLRAEIWFGGYLLLWQSILERAILLVHTRTIREAAAYFQASDPDTCLTETAIRTLLRTGAVPSVRVGRKYLVTIEALEAYLEGSVGPEKSLKAPSVKKWQIK